MSPVKLYVDPYKRSTMDEQSIKKTMQQGQI